MFDSLYVTDHETAVKITCGAGHPQLNVELQTKDLLSAMDRYYIDHGRLYVLTRADDACSKHFENVDGALLIVERRKAAFHPLNESVTVYANCHACEPIVIEHDMHGFFGSINERYPFNEWELLFKQGILDTVTPIKVQSRDDLRNELIKQGTDNVLPDDDRVARKHLEQLKNKRSRY